jgi:hypothetical protein
MKAQITAIVGAAALVVSTAAGVAATPKRKVVTQWRQALGPAVQVDRWGEIQVLLVVRKRTTYVGGVKKTVARKITAVRLPVWPNQGGIHTIGLNRQTIPILVQEVLQEQFATEIEIISEATDTSVAFEQSLQVALANARRV